MANFYKRLNDDLIKLHSSAPELHNLEYLAMSHTNDITFLVPAIAYVAAGICGSAAGLLKEYQLMKWK